MGCRRGAPEVCVRRENPGPELPKRFRGPVPVSAVAQRSKGGGQRREAEWRCPREMEGGGLVVKEDQRWGGEQGREVGGSWWHPPELNQRLEWQGRPL